MIDRVDGRIDWLILIIWYDMIWYDICMLFVGLLHFCLFVSSRLYPFTYFISALLDELHDPWSWKVGPKTKHTSFTTREITLSLVLNRNFCEFNHHFRCLNHQFFLLRCHDDGTTAVPLCSLRTWAQRAKCRTSDGIAQKKWCQLSQAQFSGGRIMGQFLSSNPTELAHGMWSKSLESLAQ